MSFRTLSSLLASFRIRALLMALLVASPVWGAPEAKLLRIDPRASIESGNPIITTVIEVAQSKRVSEAVAECAGLAGPERGEVARAPLLGDRPERHRCLGG